MKNYLAMALSGILGSLFAMSAQADVPSLLPVQGVLADASDQPVDDLLDMTFTIYPSEFGGIAVWSEVYDGTNQVDVEDGFFTVYLGEVQTLDMGILADEPQLWLGITVGTDSEMDRIRLATVPFAVEAHRCEQIGEITEADISGAPFYGISASQVSNWDAAHGWGDHGAAGYLTAEVDPLFSSSAAATVTGTQVANWDAAFTWGDHNGLYSPADHKHDDRYYTETEMQTSGSAQVNWDNLVNVPAGFADGVDNSTSVGADSTGGNQIVTLTTSEVAVRSVSITAPESGYVLIWASGYFRFRGSGKDFGRCSISTDNWMDYYYLILEDDHGNTEAGTNVDVYGSFSQNRMVSIPAGATQTYRLICDKPYSSNVVDLHDSNLTALFVANQY